MQIHRVRGNDLKDALQRARRAHGETAVVVGHEAAEDGSITLAVTNRPTVKAARAGSREATPVSFPSSASKPRPSQLAHGAADLIRRLIVGGVTESWAYELAGGVGSDPSDDRHPIDQAAQRIGASIRVAKLNKVRGVTQVISFVGSTGVGKTSSLAKLGARLVRGSQRLSMATLDTHRIGAKEQFEAYGKLLGARARALTSDTPLNAGTIGTRGADVLLLDSSGRATYDLPRLLDLEDAVREDEHVQMQSYLVLPATMNQSALLEVSSAFGDLRLSGCVITKLDEAGQVAPVLEYVHELGLPIAFFADGQDIGRSFHRATPDGFADLLLRGKLS